MIDTLSFYFYIKDFSSLVYIIEVDFSYKYFKIDYKRDRDQNLAPLVSTQVYQGLNTKFESHIMCLRV